MVHVHVDRIALKVFYLILIKRRTVAPPRERNSLDLVKIGVELTSK